MRFLAFKWQTKRYNLDAQRNRIRSHGYRRPAVLPVQLSSDVQFLVNTGQYTVIKVTKL